MKVVYLPQSVVSLVEAIEFLLETQKVPFHKVIQIKTSLLDKIDELSENPFIGQSEEYLSHLNLGHRRIIHGHFKIIYRVQEDEQLIFVTDIFDSRKDPTKMKGQAVKSSGEIELIRYPTTLSRVPSLSFLDRQKTKTKNSPLEKRMDQ